MLAHRNHALTVNSGGIPSLGTENMNYIGGGIRGCPDQLLNHKALKGGLREKVQLASKFGIDWTDGAMEVRGDPAYVRSAYEASLKRLEIYCNDIYYGQRIDTRVPIEVTDEGERFNKMSVKGKQRYICEVPKPYDEVGDGGVLYIGGTFGSSTKNVNYGRGEGRGHPDHYHIRKNHFASDDEGNYEGLTKAMQKSTEARHKCYEAAMKQNIDNKNVNDEHVVDMPKGPDHKNKKVQAKDGLFLRDRGGKHCFSHG